MYYCTTLCTWHGTVRTASMVWEFTNINSSSEPSWNETFDGCSSFFVYAVCVVSPFKSKTMNCIIFHFQNWELNVSRKNSTAPTQAKSIEYIWTMQTRYRLRSSIGIRLRENVVVCLFLGSRVLQITRIHPKKLCSSFSFSDYCFYFHQFRSG